ncbi:DUF5691 domain-containing protein [Chitinophaga sp.]|uniref:DUF5691 domain-containing protein n=1 Tax=Chitinophaga sp. TaxID=1869181 RepID=UPI002610AF7F|nr:DUF5691 domain-containing protein [uncultured Chitinophaga sp.]
MQFWTDIIQTAQLGTDKRLPAPPAGEPLLLEPVATIHNNAATDREEKFLQAAALAFNYRQSGILPARNTLPAVLSAPEEEDALCSPAAHQALKDILTFESAGLLTLWLRLAAGKKRLARPEVLPALLNTGLHQRPLRPLIEPVIGRRGKWLAQFRKEWQLTAAEPDDETWEHGTPQQRKPVLLRTALSDPAKALQWLQDTWAKETAASRTDLLKDLPAEMFATGLPWLESLLQDKSRKVKDEAIKILQKIPSSSVLRFYQDLLKPLIRIGTEKTMLGFSSRSTLNIDVPETFSDSIYKLGINKINTSANKNNITEAFMVVYQVMQYIPPEWWEAQFNATPEQLFDLFSASKTAEPFLPAIGLAVGKYRNEAWAPLFTKDETQYYADILPILPRKQRDAYLIGNFPHSGVQIIRYLTEEQEEEWSPEVARVVLKHAANNHYNYNRGFYNKFAHLLPLQIAGELEKFSPDDEYSKKGWSDLSGHILQLLSIKGQALQSFHTINP